MINNRQQTGRRRGRGGQGGQGQGGQGGQRPQGRAPEMGNRIDNRTRGNAAQLLEKYKTLARDAQQGGDRVLAEYYFQFADHYFRVLAETRARFEENRRPQGETGDGEGADDGDDEGGYDDEYQGGAVPQQARPQQRPREERAAEERTSDERPRDDRPRDDRPAREERPRDDQSRERQPRAEGEDRGQRRTMRPRYDNQDRDGRSNGNGAASPDAETRGFDEDATLDIALLPPALSVSMAEVAVEYGVEGEVADAAPVPRKRGRPRKVVEAPPADG